MKSINQQIINDLDKMVEEAQMAQHRSVDESLEISFNALEKAKKSGLHRQAANCLVLIGRSYWINGNFESALEYLDEALELCNKFQGDFIRVEAIIAIGNVYTTIEMFDLAVSNYNQALNIATVQGFDILVQ